MKIDIRELGNIESFYQGFSEPAGHGAFDPDQLLERTEDVKDDPCEYCAMYNKSDCCGAEIKWTDICTSCGEHCDIACNNCDLK
jgi:hypothetical protein